MAEFAHNLWRHENTKHTSHELIIGINPTASIRTPEDSVPAAQERLLMLNESRSDAQKALQQRIKPINPSRTFAPEDKVWLDARNLKIRTTARKYLEDLLTHQEISQGIPDSTIKLLDDCSRLQEASVQLTKEAKNLES